MIAGEGARPRFIPGWQPFTAHRVSGAPLGYDRLGTPVGAALPVSDAGLVHGLAGCDEVVVAFAGKLGDTLLALSAVRAVTDWLQLNQPGLPVASRGYGPYAALLTGLGLGIGSGTRLASRAGGRRVVVGDQDGIGSLPAAVVSGATTVVCDPAAEPCWIDGWQALPDLPARYYLSLERRLGVRLPAARPFCPVLHPPGGTLAQALTAGGWLRRLVVAAITATSRPERKDFSADRYIRVATRLSGMLRTRIQLLLISGEQAGGLETAPGADDCHVRALHINGAPREELADLFTRCDLVIGNDTGLTHLAALGRRGNGSGPPVIGLYARHSHSKWRTGLAHHHALATAFSEHMHQRDLCPVRDRIDDTAYGQAADLASITVEDLAQVSADAITGVRA